MWDIYDGKKQLSLRLVDRKREEVNLKVYNFWPVSFFLNIYATGKEEGCTFYLFIISKCVFSIYNRN